MEQFITRLFTEISETIAVLITKLNWLNDNKANIKLDNVPSNLTVTEKTNFRNKIDAPNKTDLNAYILTTQKGVANGVASLDGTGKIPTSQLPSYVDEITEITRFVTTNPTSGMVAGQIFYNTATKKLFIATNATSGTVSDPKNDTIYVNMETNFTYRWSGTDLVRLNEGVVLGTTSTTAFRGDHGLIAYNHAQSTGNPHDTKIADMPDLVTALAGKADTRLSNVVSDLSTAEKKAFRAKIGAGIGAGTVTSVGITVPTGLAVTPASTTTNAIFAISFASGYSLPTTAKQAQWDLSYTHSVAMGDATTAVPDWSAQLTSQVTF